jgi:hypothetical protein
MALLETELSTIMNEVTFDTIDNLGVSPFFIKIDVEGAELEVLKGSLTVIKKYNPVILIEIQNIKSYMDIKVLLSLYGYINIDPNKKSTDLITRATMSEITDFKLDTNNYVWINPASPISWDYR